MTTILINGLTAGCLYAIATLGFTLTLASCQYYNFAYAFVLTTGAYSVVALTSIGVALPYAAVSGVVLATLVGSLLYVVIVEQQLRGGLSSLALLLTAIGINIAGVNIIALAFGAGTRTITGIPAGPIVPALIITAAILLTIVVLLIAHRTRFGRSLRAAADDILLAASVGINVRRTRRVAVALSSCCAGVTGVLAALYLTTEPTMGTYPLLIAIAASLVGGARLGAAAVVALATGIVQHLAIIVTPARWQMTVLFLLMTTMIILRAAQRPTNRKNTV